MKTMVAILLALTSSLAFGQQHATSVEQCRADLNLWRSQLTDYLNAEAGRMNGGLGNNTEVMRLTFRQLNDRMLGLGQCASIDPDGKNAYNESMVGYGNAKEARYKFFVERHKLSKQMLAEDAAGKRI